MNQIGFIQGRLSPIVDGKLQAFPWNHWEEEFKIAAEIKMHLMEWTLDFEKIHENPLMTKTGQKKIKDLMQFYKISIPSLTADFFMQRPFFKEENNAQASELLSLIDDVLFSCSALGTRFMVIPLVDQSSIKSSKEEELVIKCLTEKVSLLQKLNMQIVFESDYTPNQLAAFIAHFPVAYFGINYDSGNSASLGQDVCQEFSAYGHRILNIHIKDRLLGGTSVPLGEGHTDFPNLFREIKRLDFPLNLILQTARAKDDSHKQKIIDYRNFVLKGIQYHA